jgi:hypothetical protein
MVNPSPSNPVPDTSDLRSGAELHDRLLALLALVGVWQGTGTVAVASTGEQHAYGQRITFAHDGRPFLAYESRTWLLDESGGTIRQAFRETGFWRPGAGQDDVEVQLADAAGIVEIFTGVAGDNRWDLITTAVAATPTARVVVGEKRLYAVRGDTLAYATELSLPGPAGLDFQPHLMGSLARER